MARSFILSSGEAGVPARREDVAGIRLVTAHTRRPCESALRFIRRVAGTDTDVGWFIYTCVASVGPGTVVVFRPQ